MTCQQACQLLPWCAKGTSDTVVAQYRTASNSTPIWMQISSLCSDTNALICVCLRGPHAYVAINAIFAVQSPSDALPLYPSVLKIPQKDQAGPKGQSTANVVHLTFAS